MNALSTKALNCYSNQGYSRNERRNHQRAGRITKPRTCVSREAEIQL